MSKSSETSNAIEDEAQCGFYVFASVFLSVSPGTVLVPTPFGDRDFTEARRHDDVGGEQIVNISATCGEICAERRITDGVALENTHVAIGQIQALSTTKSR